MNWNAAWKALCGHRNYKLGCKISVSSLALHSSQEYNTIMTMISSYTLPFIRWHKGVYSVLCSI